MRLPIIRLDPTEIGPFELARAKWESLKEWARQPIISVALVLAAVAMVVAAWRFDVSIPEIPNWGWVAIGAFALAAVPSWIIGQKITEELYSPPRITLSVLNVYNGDQRLVNLSPERFEDMTIVNHRGDEIGSERLREVLINGSRAYEVDIYDPVLNVATTSWQADRSNAEIRHDHATIREVKTEMDYEIDKIYDLLSQYPNAVRESLRDHVNEMVMISQDIQLPESVNRSLHDRVSERIEELDPSEELIQDKLDGKEAADDSDGDVDRDNVEIAIEDGGIEQ